ncbi:hypothetical protein NQ314_003157 [Rhamnusium bicolor]|uniref:Uncharacterized protein n=1 Tax=Rhamnusium bicolor TaxID=1586634 RepID=A0AAV8ZPN1_9CUCU|nr:hypothetical protein NQ314_003157 [Rhamnusium bicolor]
MQKKRRKVNMNNNKKDNKNTKSKIPSNKDTDNHKKREEKCMRVIEKENEIEHDDEANQSQNGQYGFPDFARRNKSTENLNRQNSPVRSSPFNVNNSCSGLNNLWLNDQLGFNIFIAGSTSHNNNDPYVKKPFRLEALPNIVKNQRGRLNTMEFL